MSALPTRRAFLPNELPRSKPGAALEKAAIVAARHAIRYDKGDSSLSVDQLASRMFPNDSMVGRMVTRSAVAPALTTTTGWAAELSPTLVSDFLGSLGALSAGSRLIEAGLKLSLDNIRELL